jgi:ADP-ribose pyrophosphatase YjhB (NUDIX family)
MHTPRRPALVRRRPDSAQGRPGRLTVVGGHSQAGEPLDQEARREAFEMLTHGPSYRALDRPERGGPL